MPGRPFRESSLVRGTRLLRISFLVYVGASVASATSAGLYLAAVDAAAALDPVTGAYNVAGSVALAVGGALALLTLGIFTAAFARLRTVPTEEGPALAEAFKTARAWYRIGWVCLGAGLPLLGGILAKGGQGIAAIGTALSGGAGIGFLLAILTPTLSFPGGRERLLAGIAFTVGSISVVGNTVFGVWHLVGVPLGPPVVTFGGFPLINWNVPFGLSAAASSIVLWWAYRSPGWGAPPSRA